jgi:flagellar biosynthetic protein FliO
MRTAQYPTRSIISILFAILSIVLPLHVIAAEETPTGNQPVTTSHPSTTNSTTPTSPPQPKEDDDRLPFMQNDRDRYEAEAPSTVGLLIRTFGALLLIIGLIVAVSWGMKRFGGGQFSRLNEDSPPVKVLSTVSIGDRRSLIVVRFKDRTLLVGSTPQNLSLLAEDYEDTVSETVPIRSVADILNESDSFEEEITSANNRLKQSHQI